MSYELALFGVSVVGLLVASRLFRDKFSPLFLMSAVWLTVPALFQLRLVDYYPVEDATWQLLFLAYLSFACGCLAFVLISGRPKRTPGSLSPVAIDMRRLRLAVIAMAVLGLGDSLIGVYRVAGTFDFVDLATFVFQARDVRTLHATTTTGSLQLINVALIPIAYLMALKERALRWKAFALAVGLAAAIGLSLSLGRAPLLRGIFAALIAHQYLVRPLGWKRLGVFAAVALLAFLLVLRIRSPQFGFDHRNWVESHVVQLPQWLSFLSTPYVYSTAPVVALDRIRRETSEFSWGWETLSGPRSAASKFVGIEAPSTRYEQEDVGPFTVNVSTYLRHFYLDFGVPGCVAFPFLLGFFATLCHLRALAGHQTLILPYATLAWSIAVSGFSNHFVLFAIQLLFLYLWLAGAYLLRPLRGFAVYQVERRTVTG